jgi:hypothetical protein
MRSSCGREALRIGMDLRPGGETGNRIDKKYIYRMLGNRAYIGETASGPPGTEASAQPLPHNP